MGTQASRWRWCQKRHFQGGRGGATFEDITFEDRSSLKFTSWHDLSTNAKRIKPKQNVVFVKRTVKTWTIMFIVPFLLQIQRNLLHIWCVVQGFNSNGQKEVNLPPATAKPWIAHIILRYINQWNQAKHLCKGSDNLKESIFLLNCVIKTEFGEATA